LLHSRHIFSYDCRYLYCTSLHFKRLLWIGLERTKESLEGFFNHLGKRACRALKFICSDMWQPYLDVIALKAGAAVHILDRFHIMSRMNKAIDEVRADEARSLKADGHKPVLKHSRWCILKRPENLNIAQSLRDHETLILNWFKAQGRISAGVVEGFNNKAKLAMRRSCGFRSQRVIQLALYQNLGDLPEPTFTHRFW